MYSNAEKIEWTLIFVAEFGRKFGLTVKQSFNYLTRYKGIDFIDKHYDYVHTQSFQSMINDIGDYCHRKGGELLLSEYEHRRTDEIGYDKEPCRVVDGG